MSASGAPGRLVLTSARSADGAAALAAAVDRTPDRDWRAISAHVAVAEAEPTALDPARAAVAGLPVDANWARPGARRLLIADMDSTMITVECVDEIAAAFGVGDAVAAITEQAMAGALDFEAALEARVALLRGASEASLQSVYAEQVRTSPGATDLLAGMRRAGAYAALVSGGFTFFTSRVSEALGFDEHRANVLETCDGALTGRVTPPILGRDAKAAALREICGRLGVGADAVIAVGDGANDLAMVEAAGLGVAYRAKAALRDRADAVIEHSDLTALLALQGLTEQGELAPI